MNFDIEKAKRIKEAERGYEEWVKDCWKWDEIDVVALLSESNDSEQIITSMILMMALKGLIMCKYWWRDFFEYNNFNNLHLYHYGR